MSCWTTLGRGEELFSFHQGALERLRICVPVKVGGSPPEIGSVCYSGMRVGMCQHCCGRHRASPWENPANPQGR